MNRPIEDAQKLTELSQQDPWRICSIITTALIDADEEHSLGSVNVSPSSDIGTKFSIKIKDWRSVRKWHFILDGETGIVNYNKREVARSTKLTELIAAILADERDLVRAYDRRTLEKAGKDGDVGPIIIYKLRKKAAELGYDIETSANVQHTTIRAIPNKRWSRMLDGVQDLDDIVEWFNHQEEIRVGISFDKTKIKLRIATQLRGIDIEHNMADPAFDPDKFCDNVFEHIIETSHLIQESIQKQDDIWRKGHD